MQRTRAELKFFFKTNAIPTQSNFEDLIETALNQKDDGVLKLPDDPLTIQAAGAEEAVLRFSRGDAAGSKPTWLVKQKPAGAPNAGLAFQDAGGAVRLFIESGSGNVGIGTTSPGPSRLRVAGSGTDCAHVRFAGAGSGELEFVGWNGGWNINSRTAQKHLYVNRDADETSNVYVGRVGKELTVVGVTGNVGVGTSSPTGRLNVVGASGAVGRGVQIDDQEIKFRGDGAQHFSFFNNKTSECLTLANTSAAAAMDTDGRVLLKVHRDGHFWASAATGSTCDVALSGHVQLREYSTHGLAYLQTRDDSSNRDIGLRIRTQRAQAAPAASPAITEAVTINGAGSVGIGTGSPGAKLHVAALDDALLLQPNAMGKDQCTRIKFADPDNGTGPMSLEYWDNGRPALRLVGGYFIQAGRVANDAEAKVMLDGLPNATLIIGGPWAASLYLYWKNQDGVKLRAMLPGLPW